MPRFAANISTLYPEHPQRAHADIKPLPVK